MLDRRRVDVVAAADYEVLRGAAKPDESVCVDRGEVARVEPAGEHLAVGAQLPVLALDEVAREGVRPAESDRAPAWDVTAVPSIVSEYDR